MLERVRRDFDAMHLSETSAALQDRAAARAARKSRALLWMARPIEAVFAEGLIHKEIHESHRSAIGWLHPMGLGAQWAGLADQVGERLPFEGMRSLLRIARGQDTLRMKPEVIQSMLSWRRELDLTAAVRKLESSAQPQESIAAR